MKNNLVVLPLLFILFLFFSGTGHCQSEWINTYKIEIVDENCVARWTIERKAFFESEYDEAMFSYYSSLEYHYELSNNISDLVKNASLKTGRWNMANGPLTITSSIFRSGAVSYGVVTYEYEWTEFANLTSDGRIQIGDTFVDGIFLFGNGELIMGYPSRYVVSDVFPVPNEIRELNRTIVWHELENISLEEVKIVLRKEHFMDVILGNMFLIAGVIGAVTAGFVSLWFLKIKPKKDGKPVVPVGGDTFETEDDETKVIRMLKTSGGSLFQSTITEKCGFSKAKTSLLLKAMETRSVVKRKKKGRRKIVFLTEEGSIARVQSRD